VRTLVLFDVDGTLVDCCGQTRAPFAAALEEIYGTTGDLDHYDFSGRTDPQIVLELMAGAGIARERAAGRLPAMRARYLEALERDLDPSRVRLLPGVAALVEALGARGDLAIGLLTGNWRRGAEIKLATHGLDRHFAFGAFGDDAVERDRLPPFALTRARQRHGVDFAPERTLIVGDSPLDVACARAHGLRCLAVATGHTPAERLAGAERVVADLTGGDLEEMIDA
jgi:phosphoglycolate phosphatase-like HAD superfamily hydrolase